MKNTKQSIKEIVKKKIKNFLQKLILEESKLKDSK